MSAGTIVAIVVVVIIVAALIAVGSLAARRRRLQQRFGPEYDRAVDGSDSRLKAEAALAEREKRVKGLDIRPLDPAARASYQTQWTTIQQQFVDSPTDAVTAAQTLITSVMGDRGYPTEDVDQITADLSVDHASTLGRFRTAQDISARVAGGTASTEDLRQAMVHYRALFQDLLGETVPGETPFDTTEPPVTEPPVTEPALTEPALTEPALTEPALTEPALTEPALTEPALTEPALTAPPVTEPATAAAAADYAVTGPASGPDYAEAEEIASQPDVTEPDPAAVRPAGRHHADVSGDDGAYADQAALDDSGEAEPAAASRFPWRK